jgi:hypothetical protein
LTVPLAFASFAVAQQHYLTTGAYKRVDNRANCVTHSCFLQQNATVGGTAALLQQIFTGYDAYTLGQDSNGTMWNLPIASNTKTKWTPITAMGAVAAVAIFESDTIFGLPVNTQTSCGSSFAPVSGSLVVSPGGYLVSQWQPSNSTWRSLGICATHLSVANDGTLMVRQIGGNIKYTSNPTASTPTWKSFTPTPWNNVIAYSASTAFALNGNTLYELNITANTAKVFTGAPLASSVVLTQDGYIYEVATTAGSRGNVYRYPIAVSSPSWVNITGTVDSLWGSSSDAMFALIANSPYHFLATAVQYTTTITGNYNCSIFTDGCPTGSMHTATATAKFTHGYTPGSASVTGTPATTLTAAHSDISGLCDEMFGDPSSPECVVAVNDGNVDCSEMGPIASEAAADPGVEYMGVGHVFLQNLSGATGYNCITGPFTGITVCDFSVKQWCTNQPAWTTNVARDSTPGYTAWWASYRCWVKSDGTLGACDPNWGTALKSTSVGPQYCPNPN